MIPPIQRRRPPTLPAATARRPARTPNQNQVIASRGILPQQAERGDTALAHRIYESVGPMEASYYTDGEEVPRSAPGMLREVARGLIDHRTHDRMPKPGDLAQEDAYRMYLGLPQTASSWRVSPYRPTHSTDPHAVYYTDPGLRKDLSVKNLYGQVMNAGHSIVSDLNDAGDHGQALGHATFGVGNDGRGRYVSVYDKWDLDAPGASLIGHPFEVYDRYYLDGPAFQSPRTPDDLLGTAARGQMAPAVHPDAAAWARNPVPMRRP